MTTVLAVIVEAFPFSRLAKLCAEDGRWLALTRHAIGFDAVDLRQGTWLACELEGEQRRIVAVSPCDGPRELPRPLKGDLDHLLAARAQELADALHGAPTVHQTPPVDEVPVVQLSRWQVSELTSGARHAWGYDNGAREGRASSLLAEFDPATASLQSITGRRYELVGPPGFDSDARYVWGVWLSGQRMVATNALSVTDEVWRAISAATCVSRTNSTR